MTRLILIVVALAGCYNPKIKDADFLCGPNNLCPSGFSCLAQHCYSSGHSPDLSVQAFSGNCKLGTLDLNQVFNGAGGTVSLNTETGEITASLGVDAGTLAGDMKPAPLVAPGADGFTRSPQPAGGPAVALWNFQKLVIPDGVTLSPTPSSNKAAMALAACDELHLATHASIDWSGYGAFGGGSGQAGNVRFSPDELKNPQGGGAGGSDGSGGGGGGFGEMGSSGLGAMGGKGGMIYGTPTLVPLQVGSGGGGGGSMVANQGGIGGTGGGGVALFAHLLTIGGKILVNGTDAGSFTATSAAGGGGGGSGGSILLSGDSIVLQSGHSLAARGGAGAMGQSGGKPGGAGGAGRIWIGAPSLNVSPPLTTDPAAITAQIPVDTFPR